MLSPDQILAFLGEVRLVRDFAEPDRRALAARLRERPLRRGQILFHKGDAGHEMFFVQRGTVLISTPIRDRVEQVLARVERTDFFGEMSLLDGSPRSATAQAETDVGLLVLDRQSLQALVDASPRAAAAFFYALVQVFIERLRRSTQQVEDATRWGLEATGLEVEGR